MDEYAVKGESCLDSISKHEFCLDDSERAQRTAPRAACSLGRPPHHVLPRQYVVKARILQGLSKPVPTSAPALAHRKELAGSKGCLYSLPDQHLLQRVLLVSSGGLPLIAPRPTPPY